MSDALRTAVLAVIGATLGSLLLGWVLSRIFPSKANVLTDSVSPWGLIKYQAIEWLGVACFLAGFAVPFVLQRSTQLHASPSNITMMLAFGLLFMVGGMASALILSGDRNANGFYSYLETKRGINALVVRTIAWLLVASSVISLIVLVLVSTPF